MTIDLPMKARFSVLFLALGCAVSCLFGEETEKKPGASSAGEVVFRLDLSDPAIRETLEKQGGVISNDGPHGAAAVKFHVSPGDTGKKESMAHFVLPVEKLQGARIMLTARVRGESLNSPDPKLPLPGYLGGKCQFFLNTPGRGKRWLDARGLHGTFPWKEVSMLCGVLDDATQTQVRIGVEGATGSLWVSDLKLTIVQPKAVRILPEGQVKAPPTEKRGMMSPHRFAEKDFADMAAWNVNAVRWQMAKKPDDQRPYSEWLDAELDDLALALDAAAARGIKIAVDMHSVPGDRLPDRTHRMYVEKEHHDAFIAAWEKIARRFKGHPGLWAYDLVNEPVQNYPSPPELPDWLGIQVAAGKAIRKIDPDVPLMIEVDQWDSPDSFLWLDPVDVPNVIYQAHMYWPWEFTHQGIKTNQGGADGKDFDKEKIVYPGGKVQGQVLDKESLRRYLAPVRDFQLAHGVPIFIGEFSAVRWAPGAAQYLDDCIAIFEEYGWDWTYHAFRESPVWSVEHADLPADRKNHPMATTPTEREKVLRKWFALNKRPGHAEVTAAVPIAAPAKESPPIRKILFVGDSITFHAPSKNLGWTGNWGMAADSEANDYVHQLGALVAKAQGTEPELLVQAAGGGTLPAKLANAEALKGGDPDVIVVQMGENDNISLDEAGFQKPYEDLVVLLRDAHPEARIVCTGVWRGKKGKDEMIKEVCRKHRIPFAHIAPVSANLQNRAAISGQWENPGVAWHPNNAGMKGYADAIWAALQAGDTAIPE